MYTCEETVAHVIFSPLFVGLFVFCSFVVVVVVVVVVVCLVYESATSRLLQHGHNYICTQQVFVVIINTV